MLNYYAFIALDIANQRVREAERERLVRTVRVERESAARRHAAIALAAFGRLVAAGVRRLDECVADDLAESIRPAIATSH